MVYINIDRKIQPKNRVRFIPAYIKENPMPKDEATSQTSATETDAEKNVSAVPKTDAKYTGEEIKALNGLEVVRMRPGMHTLLMGDAVDPRREYIERHAAGVKDLDI